MDKIRIKSLRLPIVIGILEHERKFPQNVVFNIELEYDMRKAGETDNLFDAVDYSAVERRIVEFVSTSRFQLLEALGEGVVQNCFSMDERIQTVRVRITKPAAAVRAEAIEIEIERSRK